MILAVMMALGLTITAYASEVSEVSEASEASEVSEVSEASEVTLDEIDEVITSLGFELLGVEGQTEIDEEAIYQQDLNF